MTKDDQEKVPLGLRLAPLSRICLELTSDVTHVFGVEVPWTRASGDCICEKCNKKYYDHPSAKEAHNLDWEGRPFLRRLCDGSLVKL